MKILIILPDASMHKLRLGSWVLSMREAPLTHTTLGALTPPHPDIELQLVDGSVEPIPLGASADLVAISVITGCAPRAYAIADHFRKRGVPVVLGGVHVTILPGEAAAHADAIVVGRAEGSWPELVNDFRAGRMKRVYQEERDEAFALGTLPGVPLPRRDLQRRRAYVVPNTVQASRGCMRDCDFCTAPAVWPKYLRRPVADVVRDIRSTTGKRFVFNDVSLVDDRDYARELFAAIAPLKKCWGGLVTADVGKDPELLDLMARSGCHYLLIGFESTHQITLRQINKGFNKVEQYRDLMRQLHSHHISVQGCFVFGFDEDTPEVFRSTVDWVQELRMDIPRYSLYTPYPGTKLFQRLQQEERILSYNWNDYDTMHVVIQPKQMSPDALYDGFKWAYKETYRTGRILGRVRGTPINAAVNFMGGVTYRVFAHRLYHDPRFAQPFSRENPGHAPAPDAYRVPVHEELVRCPA